MSRALLVLTGGFKAIDWLRRRGAHAEAPTAADTDWAQIVAL
jgi:hypothetical protein